MAENINRVTITGNLTADPELRHTGNGTPVCQLRVAVNGRRKEGDQWVDKPNYFNVTIWGAQGENANTYLEKGRPVAIDGRLDWREWEKDGNKHQTVEIVADVVQFLGTGNNSGGNSGGDAPPAAQPAATGGGSADDDIPF